MFAARLTVGRPRLAWAEATPGPRKEGNPKLGCWAADPRPCNACWVDCAATDEVTYGCWPPLPMEMVVGCMELLSGGWWGRLTMLSYFKLFDTESPARESSSSPWRNWFVLIFFAAVVLRKVAVRPGCIVSSDLSPPSVLSLATVSDSAVKSARGDGPSGEGPAGPD